MKINLQKAKNKKSQVHSQMSAHQVDVIKKVNAVWKSAHLNSESEFVQQDRLQAPAVK